MTPKRILGFIFLFTFIGFMAYKLSGNLSGNRDAAPIGVLILAVVGIVVFFVYKILREE